VKGRRFRSRCLVCKWISKLNRGPVFAGWDGMKHVNQVHPASEGFVTIIEEVLVE
jgi:hypothetical protein